MARFGWLKGGQRRQREEQVEQVVLDLILASTDEEADRFAEAHHDELLSDGAQRVFDRLIQESRNDPRTARRINQRRALVTGGMPQMSSREMRKWVQAQNKLAASYLERGDGSPVDNLLTALDIYDAVLERLDPETFPQEWATTHADMARAYWTQVPGDRGLLSWVVFDQAINHFYAALLVWTRDKYPLEWAETQVNLGLTYLNRRQGAQWGNIEDAIEHLQNAFEVITPTRFPEQWVLAQSGLGYAYLERAVPGSVADNIETAIEHLNDALRVEASLGPTEHWSTIHYYLGRAYLERLRGQRADNVEQAIHHLQLALYQLTLVATPGEEDQERRTLIQTGLGDAYASRVQGHRAQNVEQAVTAYREALQGALVEETPTQARTVQRKLGDLYLAERRWADASQAYHPALEATDLLYEGGGTTPGARNYLLKGYGELPLHAAYALARLGRLAEAVEMVENGRTRALSEALARNVAALELASPADREAFVAARAHIARLEAQARAAHQATPEEERQFAQLRAAADAQTARELIAALKAEEAGGEEDLGPDELGLSSDLLDARQGLAEIVAHIQGYAPDFLRLRFSFSEIVAVADAVACPLMYLLTTPVGALALIVAPGVDKPARQHVVWLDRFGSAEFDQVLHFQREDQPFYLAAVAGQEPPDALMEVLDRIWPILGDQLVAPVVARLRQLGYERAVLIPTLNLGLLPLPSLALDDVLLTYAPSARTLQLALQSAERRANQPPLLLGIGNPLPNPAPLPFARLEVQEIAALYPAEAQRLLYGSSATRSAVLGALQGATHLHFSCHGEWNVADALDSALALSGDDRLTVRDLLDGDLDLSAAQLAVLSACQTGITDFINVPEEMVGLPVAFLQAGVPGVVSALWSVTDVSTALLLTRFYRHHVREGRDPAEALHMAQGWLRRATVQELGLVAFCQRLYQESGRRDRDALQAMRYYQAHPQLQPFAHPYYWAAFVFSGVKA